MNLENIPTTWLFAMYRSLVALNLAPATRIRILSEIHVRRRRETECQWASLVTDLLNTKRTVDARTMCREFTSWPGKGGVA